MPDTPVNFKLALRRNSYCRVDSRRESIILDTQPLQDVKQMQENGTTFNADISTLPNVQFINHGTEDQMEIRGYVRSKIRAAVCWLFVCLTVGCLRLVFHWYPHWMLYATHKPSSLEKAEKVLVIECYQQKHKCYYVKEVKKITVNSAREDVKKGEAWGEHNFEIFDKLDATTLPVLTSDGDFKECNFVRLFNCKKITYIWDFETNEFIKLKGLDHNISTATLHQQKGLSLAEQFLRRAVYGANEIVVPMRTVAALLFLEVLNPFYIFQIFSFVLWMLEEYYYYAACIIFMSLCSVIMAVIQTRRNQLNLWSRVYCQDVARVVRRGEDISLVPTEQLVPGDLLALPPHGCTMHCDAVLLTGTCIVNESMLTGESVPVTKTPLPNCSDIPYDEKEHARHTLYSGTHVIQTRYYGQEKVYAVVIRTSFSTGKGSLVRSILYPPPVDFKFERDSYKFIQMLASIAAMGFFYTIVSKIMNGYEPMDVALEALDLITIVVPPALPAAMTVGRIYAQSRLQTANIFCISPRAINVSGSINCICFDKTGTLTEDGLDMWGAVPVMGSKFKYAERDVSTLAPTEHLVKAMATCHSLTMIDGSLAGDPLDLKMFESTGWILEEPEVSDDTKYDLISPTIVKPLPSKQYVPKEGEPEEIEVGIVRQFPFSSSLQRMSVITRLLGAKHFTVYAKGSPEMIAQFCDPSTVPEDFESELEGYTREGYRVLGVAYKELPPKVSYVKAQRLSREDAESNLIFLGLVVMENRLKPQTTGVLTNLRNASIRTIMVTGDNMLTALSVARDCGIIPTAQNVIMVHSDPQTSDDVTPSLHFVQQTPHRSMNSREPIKYEISQMTITESISSLHTFESLNGYVNGTMKGTVIDLPMDNATCQVDMNNGNEYCMALTGQTWTILRTHYPEIMARIATRGAVFARMSPDNKQQLVLELQSLGYFVAMVGDGANDCGALKAAHAGISLSEAESSVASPFTSKDANISCIVEVIREGRTALVTSFAIFKYMAAYSLIQFASVIILYSVGSNLTDLQFLYIDLFEITIFAFVLGRVASARGALHPRPPESSLISFTPIASLAGQMIVALACQFFAFFYVQDEPWFVPFNGTSATVSDGGRAGFENYSVFAVSSFQYIILALVFSRGAPYRRSVLSSPLIISFTVLITGFTIYLIVYPASWFIDSFEMVVAPDMRFRIIMLAVAFINTVIAVIYERLCNLSHNFAKRCTGGKEEKYEELDREMNNSKDWPPLEEKVTDRQSTSKGKSERHRTISQEFPHTTVTFINSPAHLESLSSSSGLPGEEGKFSTPMKSGLSLVSEDNISKYSTPPSSPIS